MKKAHKFTPDEDSPLLLSWHRGDISAFEALVWKYLKRAFSLAFYLTGKPESAATVTQSVFVAAFNNIHTFSSRLHFSNWLVSLTLNETRKLLESSNPLPPIAPAEQNGMLEHLPEMLLRLPSELTEILVMHDVRGYPLDRIAEIYQLRPDIMATKLFHAHEMLAALLKTGAPASPDSLPHGEPLLPHPEIRISFHAYLDSSLSVEEAAAIKNHLKSCGSCRDALTRLEWVVEHLKKLPDIDPPNWLGAAIMRQVKSAPLRAEKTGKTAPAIYLQIGAILLLLVTIGLSAYLLKGKSDVSPQTVPGGETVTAPPTAKGQEKPADFISSITATFRGSLRQITPSRNATPLQAPLPPPAPSTESPAAAPPSPASTTGAAPVKSEAAVRRNWPAPPELPSEWGQTITTPRIQKSKPAERSRSGELAVELKTEDPLAAIPEIENAVTSLGGKITGRAYSSGSDILYTRIDVDRFFDLMGRLGKTGRIQELPHIPEGVEGPVELMIKWH